MNIENNIFLHIENGIVFAYGVLKDKNTLQTVVKRQVRNESPGKREHLFTFGVEEIHLDYEGGTDGRYIVSQPQVLVVGKLTDKGIRVLHIYNSPDGLWGEPLVMLEQTAEHIPMFLFVSQDQVREDLANCDRRKKRLYLLESPKGVKYLHSGTQRRIKKVVVELDKYDSKAPALFVVKGRKSTVVDPFADSYREQEDGKDTSIIHIKATQVGCRH